MAYLQKTSEFLFEAFTISIDAILLLLPKALLFSFFSFIASIIVLWFANRKGLFKRENKIWNVLSKLHYPIWMMIFIGTGFMIGATNSAISEADRILRDTFRPYVEANLPALKDCLVERLPEYDANQQISIGEASQRILESFNYEQKTDGIIETAKARCNKWITRHIRKWMITYSVSAMVHYATQSAGHALYISDATINFTKDTIMRMDMSQVDKNLSQLVYEAVSGQVRALIRGYQIQLLLFSAFLLAIVCIEPGVYFLWWKKRSGIRGADKK